MTAPACPGSSTGAGTTPRKIGFWTCTALVVGNVIGMGIFVLPASLAPYGLNAMFGWALVLAGCLALAGVFARLAKLLPDVGGPYGYIRQAFGELPAYLTLWAYWVSLWLTNAALATGVVGYMVVVFPPLEALSPPLFALALTWAVLAVNLFGVRSGGRVQIVTAALKLLPMLAIAVLGGWLLLHTPASYAAQVPATPITTGGVLASATIALFAMLGIESASVPAARVDTPGRTIPRSTLTGTIIAAAVYVVVSAVPLLLIPQHELATASAPFAVLMDRYAMAGSGRWLALFVVISGLGALNGWTLLAGELTQTMAGHGVFPAVLARNNRHGAPMPALILVGLLASVMIVTSYSKSLVGAFTFLTRVVTVANLPLYLCCTLALLVVARRAGQLPRLPWVALISLLFVVLAFVGAGREPFLYALGLIAAGLPIYFLVRLRRRAPPPAEDLAE